MKVAARAQGRSAICPMALINANVLVQMPQLTDPSEKEKSNFREAKAELCATLLAFPVSMSLCCTCRTFKRQHRKVRYTVSGFVVDAILSLLRRTCSRIIVIRCALLYTKKWLSN